MTQETFNSRRPIEAELRIIHQYTDPNSTKGRTLSEIVNCVGDDQLIIDLISYGQACDHYKGWKDHPNEYVRLSSATNGYFLSHYIHDESDHIKYTAISKQPGLMNELLDHPTAGELRFARYYLYDQASPDIQQLKAYLKVNGAPKNRTDKALQIKYLAETTELEPLMKTMTRAQLFIINHPAWAKGCDPEAIAATCNVVHTLRNMGYTNKSAYADILLAIADEYQNESFHYYSELHADAVSTIKEQVRPDTI